MRSDRPRPLLTSCDATAGLRQSARVPVALEFCAVLDTFLADAAVRLHPETPCFADFEADDAGIERDEPAVQLVRPVLRSAPLASRAAGIFNQWLSITRSISPYAAASSAVKKRSRSESWWICSGVLPV